MYRVLGIGWLFFAVHGWHDAWPEAVIEIVEESFNRPVVLFLDNQDSLPRRRALMPLRDFSKRARVLSVLAGNFSLLVANPEYIRPDEESIYLRLGLVRAGQIIALVGESTVSDSEELSSMVRMWRNNAVWFGRAKILVIIESRSDGWELANKIISELWRQVKAVSVLVLIGWGDSVKFYSFVPYDESCRVEAKIVGFWNKTHHNYKVFPVWPFLNLNNCTLKVTATELIPYVFPPKENGEYTDGIEVRAFRLLSTILNFTYEFNPVPEGENPWATMLDDKPVGFIGMLVKGESDICLSGGRLNYERCMLADPLDPYISDDFVWVGPAPERTARWKAVFLVFSPDIWMAIATTFVASLLFTWFVYRKRFPASTAFLVVWTASLSNTSPSSLLPFSIRGFFGCFLFYTLTINSLYTSALYGVLTKGLKLEPIDSNTQAADLGLTASIFASNMIDLEQTVPKYYKQITENNLIIWTNDFMKCLRRAARNGDCYTLFTALGSTYHINMRFTSKLGRPYVRIMKKRYKSYVPTIYMARHHPLHPLFRKLMGQLVENGWVQMQATHIMTESLRMRLRHSEVKDFSEIEEKKKLGLDQLLGAFLAYSVMLMLAILAFLYELWTDYRLRRGQYLHDELRPKQLKSEVGSRRFSLGISSNKFIEYFQK